MANFLFVLATLLATSYALVEAIGGNYGIEDLRNKVASRFSPRIYGGGASAASSVGGSGRDLYSSATANAAPYYGGYQYKAPPAPVYAHNPYPFAHYGQEVPVYAPYSEPEVNPYDDEAASYYDDETASYYDDEPPRPRAHRGMRPHHPVPHHSSATAAAHGRGAKAAASVGSPSYARPSPPAPREPSPPPAPKRPEIGLDQYKGRNVALSQARPGNKFGRYGPGGAALAASSGGVALAAASSGSHGPNSYAASAGTYANDGFGRESGSYQRSTSSEDVVENGNADDDHYYKAGTYGKAANENMYEAYNKDDDDIEHTDNVYRRKKRGENYTFKYNKADSESGSNVLAKDHHSSRFSKNVKKFNENVDEKFNKEGNGITETKSYSNSHQIDDEDEDAFDSDGFGKATPVTSSSAASVSQAPTPSANHNTAAATSSVSKGATSSAASAVGSNY